MRKALEYRLHVEECRALASRGRTPEERDLLLNMAVIWESLAQDRERDFRRNSAASESG
jgi:hypothetical protein